MAQQEAGSRDAQGLHRAGVRDSERAGGAADLDALLANGGARKEERQAEHDQARLRENGAFALAAQKQQQEAQQALEWLEGNAGSGGVPAQHHINNGLIEAKHAQQGMSENASFLLSFSHPQPVIETAKGSHVPGSFPAPTNSSSGRPLSASSHMLPPRSMRAGPQQQQGLAASMQAGQQQLAWQMGGGSGELGRVEEEGGQNRHHAGGLDTGALLDHFADLHGSDLLMRDWPGALQQQGALR